MVTKTLTHYNKPTWKAKDRALIIFAKVKDRDLCTQNMNKENLVKYYQSVLPMSVETAKRLTEKSELIEMAKNELLIKENKVSDKSYFLEQGFIRSYTFDSNGEEITTNIFSAPCVVNDFLSFFKKQPSQENFQTLTVCTLWQMSYQDVQVYFHTIPEFREYGRLLLVNNYSLLHERMIGMIKDTAETRYLKLMKTHPDIFQNVPLKIIASYLGITDSSLSRIRKEITKK